MIEPGTTIHPGAVMKKLFAAIVILLLSVTAYAQAKAYYSKSDGDHPIIRASVTADSVRTPRAKRLHPWVNCRDGSKSYSRQNVCTGHGGAAHRSPMM
jgi:hypothetical protein